MLFKRKKKKKLFFFVVVVVLRVFFFFFFFFFFCLFVVVWVFCLFACLFFIVHRPVFILIKHEELGSKGIDLHTSRRQRDFGHHLRLKTAAGAADAEIKVYSSSNRT